MSFQSKPAYFQHASSFLPLGDVIFAKGEGYFEFFSTKSGKNAPLQTCLGRFNINIFVLP